MATGHKKGGKNCPYFDLEVSSPFPLCLPETVDASIISGSYLPVSIWPGFRRHVQENFRLPPIQGPADQDDWVAVFACGVKSLYRVRQVPVQHRHWLPKAGTTQDVTPPKQVHKRQRQLANATSPNKAGSAGGLGGTTLDKPVPKKRRVTESTHPCGVKNCISPESCSVCSLYPVDPVGNATTPPRAALNLI